MREAAYAVIGVIIMTALTLAVLYVSQPPLTVLQLPRDGSLR